MNLVYDLSVQPFALGDLLTHQQASLVLRGDEKVNVHVIHKNSFINDDKPKLGINWLMPAAHVNQHLGEVTLSESIEVKDYWPTDHCYTAYKCWETLVAYYEKHGEFEALKPLPDVEKWAKDFVRGATTIQFRRNDRNPARNSDYKVWIDFIKRYDHHFLIVCSESEVDPAFRLPNVTVVCDYGFDAQKICAIVEASPIHLGVSSGPAQMRMYGKKPFCIFKDTLSPKRVRGFLPRGDGHAFPWMTDLQSMIPQAETVERISQEFERMYEGIHNRAIGEARPCSRRDFQEVRL